MMKKYMSILLVMLLFVGLLLGGCSGNNGQKQEEQQQTQQEEQQAEVATLVGEFQGLADGHSVEITVEGEPQVFQFFDEDMVAVFETMETGTELQFDVQTDAETEVKTIVKLYDETAQG